MKIRRNHAKTENFREDSRTCLKIMCTSHKLKENTQRAPHQSDHKCKDRSKTLIPHSAQSSKFTPICHHCGVEGHIRPLCY
ncbi:hypothetical protein ACOSP7_028380 [Xanthoceras sorbifolium]